MKESIDIFSKGEVASYLAHLSNKGQIKKCKYLGIKQGHARAFYPRCTKQWASHMSADNVYTDITAYDGPSSYSWPVCPEDCPHLLSVDDFKKHLGQPLYYGDENVASPTVQRQKVEFDYQKITISALIHHVPVKFWIGFVATIMAVFVAGLRLGSIKWVQEIFTKLGL